MKQKIIFIPLLACIVCLFANSVAIAQALSDNSPIRPARIWRFPLPKPLASQDSITINELIKRSVRIQWQFPDSALYLLEKARIKSLDINNYELAADATTYMGISALGKGDFKGCFKYYNLAYEYIKRSNNEIEYLPRLYIDIGVSYYYQGNFQKAFEYYYSILQFMLRESPANPNLVMVYNNIADALMHMKQYEKAMYYIQQGEDQVRKTRNEGMLSYILTNKADIELWLGNYEASRTYSNEALRLALKYGNKEAEQAIYILKGNYMIKLNRPQEAIENLNKALKTNTTIYPFFTFIAPYYTLGTAYYQVGDYKNAEKVLIMALDKAQTLRISSEKLEALQTLSKIYEKTGRYKDALSKRNEFDLLMDSIQTTDKVNRANELEVKFRTAQKDKKIIQNELLIIKQNREIVQKNIFIFSAIAGLTIIILFVLTIYLQTKNKNRIIALHAKLEGEEKERSRIAAELHDGIGGMLAVIKMKLTSGIRNHMEEEEIINLLNDTSSQVRSTAHNLMPDVVTELPLKESLIYYVENINHANSDIKIELDIHTDLNIKDNSTKLSVYRMIQEIIQNIIKHAKATHATIQIFQQNGKFHFLIEDNGIGFDYQTVKKGLGLTNLENRVKILNGIIYIDASQGKGTIINIEF